MILAALSERAAEDSKKCCAMRTDWREPNRCGSCQDPSRVQARFRRWRLLHRKFGFAGLRDDPSTWLNLTRAAAYVKISAKTLRLAAESGEIEGLHPLPEGPWLFSRAVLDDKAVAAVVERAKSNGKYPTGPHPAQQTLFSSTT